MVMYDYWSHTVLRWRPTSFIAYLFCAIILSLAIHEHSAAGLSTPSHLHRTPILRSQSTIIGEGAGNGEHSDISQSLKLELESKIPPTASSDGTTPSHYLSSQFGPGGFTKSGVRKNKRSRFPVLARNPKDLLEDEYEAASHESGLIAQAEIGLGTVTANLQSDPGLVPENFQPNVLLGIANPSAAANHGGQVIGGAPLLGGFFPPAVSGNAQVRPETPHPVQSYTPVINHPTSLPTPPSSSVLPSSTPAANHLSPQLVDLPSSAPANREPSPNQPSPTNYPVSEIESSPVPSSLEPAPFSQTDGVVETNTKIPTEGIIGIVIAIAFVFVSPFSCFLLNRRQQRRKRKIEQNATFMDNPIINSTLVRQPSAGGSAPEAFRGTPYSGNELDYIYIPPTVSVEKPLNEVPALKSRFSLTATGAIPAENMKAMEDRRIDDIFPAYRVPNHAIDPQEKGGNKLDAVRGRENTHDQVYPWPSTSAHRYDAGLSGSSSEGHRDRESSIGSDEDLIFEDYNAPLEVAFPKGVMLRHGPKIDAAFHIDMDQHPRVVSQIATAELDQEANRCPDPLSILPSFYIPRSGDPNKIRFSRSVFSRKTDPDHETGPGLPEVPGPILSRTRTPAVPRSYEIRGTVHASGPEVQLPSGAMPPKNRYIPSNTSKKPVNTNVYNALSSRKSSMRVRASEFRDTSDSATSIIPSSLDVPDPIGALASEDITTPTEPLRFKAGFYKQC